MSTDDQSVAGPTPAPRPVWVKAVLIILGILFLLPGACGSLFYGAALWEWVSGGFDFKTGHENYTGVIPVFAVPSILASIFAIGLLMRFVQVKSAPTISLWLAILAAAIIFLSYFVFRSAFSPMDMEDNIVLFLVAIAALVVVALPSFQHWRSKQMNASTEE